MRKGKIKHFLLLSFSILFSLMIHCGIIFFLYNHFLSFYRNIGVECKGKKILLPEEKIVSFAFDLKSVKGKQKGKIISKLIHEKERKIIIVKNVISSKIDKITSNFSYQRMEYLKNNHLIEDKKKGVTIEKKFNSNLENIVFDLKKHIPIIPRRENIKPFFKSYPIFKLSTEAIKIDNKIDLPEERFFYNSDLKIEVEKKLKNIFFKLKEKIFEMKGKRKMIFPYKTFFPSLKDLNTISLQEEFELNVEYVKTDEGYIFAIILIPNLKQNNFKRIKQNFWFLVDTSNAIQNKRLNITRQAIQGSLSFFKKEDYFNIFTFDNKMKVLFSDKKKTSNYNINTAKKFLMEMTLGSFFSSTNFFNPFNRIYRELEEDEINNIILLSNGEGWNKYKNRQLIKNLTEFNKGFLSLYALSLAEDKDTSALDLFTNLNRGKLIISSTLRGIKRHLFKLVKNLEYPISKDITTKVYGENVELFYPKERSILYLSQPLVLMGKIDNLEDFTIFIQGKNLDKWINIKKRISFANAKNGSISLKKKWAKNKAQKYYNLYLLEENIGYLKKAEEILRPFNISIAFR